MELKRPKIADTDLSSRATEEILDSVPSSKEAEEITNLAKKEKNLNLMYLGLWLLIIVIQKNLFCMIIILIDDIKKTDVAGKNTDVLLLK